MNRSCTGKRSRLSCEKNNSQISNGFRFCFFIDFFLFFIAFTLFGITNHLTHEVYVFKGVLKKEWWKGKEDKIKEWLAKHFGKNS